MTNLNGRPGIEVRPGAGGVPAKDFATALDASKQAFALAPLPALVYNHAAALDKLGNAVGAIQAYERYLTLVPKAGDAEEGARAHREAARLALAR